MWHEIQEIITPYCANGAGYMLDYLEDPNCTGFLFRTTNNSLYVRAKGVESKGHTYVIEEDMRIFYKDPPGTFEGISQEANT